MVPQNDFVIGAIFESFTDFEEKFNIFQNENNVNFVVAKSLFLKLTDKVTAEIKDKFKYDYIQYTCKYHGTVKERAIR